MAFHYRTRSVEEWEKRANQSGGDWESWVKDEYRNFTPSKGENCVRLLPPSPAWEDAGHYGMDVWVHYGIGPEKASVICLFKQSGKPCAICEERIRAERAGDSDLAKDLKATRRVLAFIIDRKDEGKGVLAWGMPYTVDREIAKASKDRSTGEYYFVDHPERGYDVYFDRDGEGLATKYNGVGLARRPSHVAEKYLEWLKDKPLPEVLRWRDYDEVKRLYEGFGRGENPDDATETARGRGDDTGRRGGRERPPLRVASDRGERQPASDRGDRRLSEDREPPPHDDPDDGAPFDYPDEPHPEPLEAHGRSLERPGARLSRPGAAVAPAADPTRAVPRPDPGADPTRVTPRSAAVAAGSDGKSRAAQLRARFLEGA